MTLASTRTVDWDALLDHVVERADLLESRSRPHHWTPEEDQFILEHLGWLTDEEIGKCLGRSTIAVHLRWDRDLGLRGPSKAPEVVTAHGAAHMLGIDGHKVAHWVDVGLIPGRIMAGGRKIRLIRRVTFLRWACSPANWPYFDRKKVRDPHLKRLLKLEAKRWGDEWWSTRQVADYHGVKTSDVKRYIQLGYICSFRMPYSLGGRHEDRTWSYHYVLRSEATRPDLHFMKRGDDMNAITERGKAWLRKALKRGMPASAIARTMHVSHSTIDNWTTRYFPELKRKQGGQPGPRGPRKNRNLNRRAS